MEGNFARLLKENGDYIDSSYTKITCSVTRLRGLPPLTSTRNLRVSDQERHIDAPAIDPRTK